MKFIYDRNKVAVVFEDRKYTFKEIIKDFKYYSTLIDIKEGDKVVTTVENRPEIIMSIYGTWEKKGIATILDAGYTPEQYAYSFKKLRKKVCYSFRSRNNKFKSSFI